MSAPLLALLTVLALPGATREPAQELTESQALAAFKKGFHSNPRRPKPVAERAAALRLLDFHDSADVAEELVDSYEDLEDEVVELDLERDEVLEQLVDMVRGQELKERNFTREVMAGYQALKKKATELRKQIDSLRDLQKQLLEVLEEKRDEDTLAWLLDRVIGSKRLPLTLQITTARACAERPDVMAEPFAKALGKARKSEELAILLDAMGRMGSDGRVAGPSVLAYLDHKEATVRERAAWALARIGMAEAIAPLIDQLEEEEDGTRTQLRMAAALEVLTSQKLGASVSSWRRWFEAEGQPFLEGTVPLGLGESKIEAPRSGYYFGLPQEGHSIIYVIDCSGSMVVSLEHPQEHEPAPEGEESRIEACKKELRKALGQLNPDHTTFNIIYYNDLPHVYSKQMLKARKKEIEVAQKWVDKLSALETTNIHDALERAFHFAGRGAVDRHYESAVDTIFLLSDGSPTTPDGKLDSTDKILESVRRWNPYGRVVIHTIGIGKGINVPFMRKLATENGGRFVGK